MDDLADQFLGHQLISSIDSSSSSSICSSKAPSEFNIPSSLTSSTQSNPVANIANLNTSTGRPFNRLTVSKSNHGLRCQVCESIRTTFFCSDCIKKGEFTSSKSTERFAERFAEKKFRFLKLQHEQDEINGKVGEHLVNKIEYDLISHEIRNCELNNYNLREKIDAETKKLKDCKKLLDNVLRCQNRCKYAYKVIEQKVDQVNKLSTVKQEKIRQKYSELEMSKMDIKNVMSLRFSQLSTYCFPIETYLPDENPETGLISSGETTPLLTFSESGNSSSGSSSGTKYTIVEPWLPENGDYSDFGFWVAGQKSLGAGSSLSELSQRNPAFRITAALSYVNQLISILSYLLDARLPKKVSMSEFNDMDFLEDNQEDKFAYKVVKLNLNLIHLCVSQKLSAGQLKPRHTIQNLLQLLDSSNPYIGSTNGCIEYDDDLFDMLDYTFGEEFALIDEPMNISDYVTNDEDDFSDFEPIPYPVPFDYPITQSQTQSSVGGFINSVASLWRTTGLWK